MAKKKTEVPEVEAAVVETQEKVETVAEQTKETIDQADEQPNTENSDQADAAPAEQTKEQEVKAAVAIKDPKEIPANVQRILKVFSDKPELYVGDNGRVFSPEAKPSLRGNAILYKNPFYNSKS